MNKKQEISLPFYRGGLLFLVLPAVTEEIGSISTAADVSSSGLFTDADLAVALFFPFTAVELVVL